MCAGAAAGGRDAVGTGGLPGTLGAPGFAPTGGGAGLGFEATGGGGACLPANELPGLECAGVLSCEDPFDSAAGMFFFQGVADPFAGIIPGKTDTGFA